MDKRKSGSYYTPTRFANLVADYCLSKITTQDKISIIEPSVGDGSFIGAISRSENLHKFRNINITAVEKDLNELTKACGQQINEKIVLRSFNSDYLQFHFQNNESYSLYIGNPPYVKKNLLDEEQKRLAKLIHAEKGLSDKSINNIWTSFLVSGLSKLNYDGILALILPLELLQVKFTDEIRNLLKNEFERMEIFTFNELQFHECKGQDTVLLIGYKKHINPGTYYTNIASLDDLESKNYVFYQNTALSDSDKKWTHHFITPEEYDFLEGLKNRLKNVSHYLDNKAGIVTAANDFFIVNEDVVFDYNLGDFAKPILQKGFFVNGSISFTTDDFQMLVRTKKPAYLLDFTDLKEEDKTNQINNYLNIGIGKKIHDRYKCKQRTNWYQVPNIASIPQAFFFKRAHDYPKILSNEAGVLVTDSAYKIEMKGDYNIHNFIFSFYNSLTLAFSELEGRYYGGGVLELTPNEFRILPIPYVKVEDFEDYKRVFKNKKSIENILAQYNYKVLNTALGLSQDEINKIEMIRKKLVNKRQRN